MARRSCPWAVLVSVAFNDLFILIALSPVGALLLLNWILFLNTHQLERDIGAAFLICALFLAFNNVKTIIPQPGKWGPIPSCLLSSQNTDWLLILQTLKDAFCSKMATSQPSIDVKCNETNGQEIRLLAG